jgi:hypothetical protein
VPNDVDLIVLLQIENGKKERWSADIEFVSTREQAQEILKAVHKYMEKRYGSKNARIFEPGNEKLFIHITEDSTT